MHICLIHVEQEPTQAGFHTGVQEVGPPPHRRSLGGAEESENGSAGLKKGGSFSGPVLWVTNTSGPNFGAGK